MLYRYRAATPQGQIVKGEVQALHELDLEAQLAHMGLLLLRASANHRRSVQRLTPRARISLLFQLELLLRAGVPLLSALGDLRQACEAASSRQLCAGLAERIEGGATLAQAMAGYPGVFPQAVVQLVRCGEVSGQLAEVLQETVRWLKWQDELAAKTRRLLLYPGFVLAVITAVIVFLMVYLVPQLVLFLTSMGRAVPLQTRLLIALSDLFAHHGWLLLCALALPAAALAALAWAHAPVRQRLHQAQLALPLFGPVLKKMLLARFATTLSLLYRSGVPLIEALAVCQKISHNLALQQAIGAARERVVNGATLSEGFAAESVFSPLVIRMLKVGESTGALDAALSQVSYSYVRDIDESVGRLQALTEPALTLLLGLVLGWITLAVLGPIYDTIASLKL